MVTNVLSVDVEEYFHAAIFRAGAAMGTKALESRVEQNVERLLALLHEHHATGTFFVLGEIAVDHPRVVRMIAGLGHEIACHGDRHEDVYRQNADEFRADIVRAKARLEDILGQPVTGYRAPNFSIGRAQEWAYSILIESGFEYDSSLYPISHDRYGRAEAPRFPYEIWREGTTRLVEFPVGTARMLGRNLPIGGGGYFRLMPFAWTERGFRRVNVREQRPVMFYLHPWELDPDMPRPPMAWRHRFRHYVGVAEETAKLSSLLELYSFASAREVLDLWTRYSLPGMPSMWVPQPGGVM